MFKIYVNTENFNFNFHTQNLLFLKLFKTEINECIR